MANGDLHERPASLAEALDRLGACAFRPLAGGTDLYPGAQGRELSGDILDLTAIEALSRIELGPSGLRIGACATWSAIAAAALPPALAGLQQAAREVGGRQIQNAGTIGGNLCNASPAADGVPPLMTLDASVEISSAAGQRQLRLADFITGPRRTALQAGELVTAIVIPRPALTGRSVFRKLGARKYLVISIASVALRVVEREGRIADAYVAVGACSAVPQRLAGVEAVLRDQPVSRAEERVTDGVVAAALAPLDDIRASAAYRSVAAAELVRRAVGDLCGGGHA